LAHGKVDWASSAPTSSTFPQGNECPAGFVVGPVEGPVER